MRYLLMLFGILFSVCAGAAMQYAAPQGGSANPGDYTAIKQNEGVGVVMDSAGSLFIRGGSSLPAGISQFGYYIVGKEQPGTHAVDLVNVEDKGIFVGNFSEGDKVAFWMKTEDGQILDSMHDDRKGDDRYAAYIKNNGDKSNVDMVLGFGGYGGGYGPVKPDAADNGYIFEVIGGGTYQPHEPAPSGQPLPGTAAVLVVGAALTGYWLWRRRVAHA